MDLPALCLNCFKQSNKTVVSTCEPCKILQFPERMLCDIARLNVEENSFNCDAFKPKLSLVQGEKKESLDLVQTFAEKKGERGKWIVSYILQQHKLNPNQIQFKLKYHLVLITENRAPLFSDRYFQPFSEIFSRVARSFSKTDIELIWLASDHLHLFLDTSPDYPVDEIVHIGIKKSEFEILNRFPEFQQKTETVWKRDYFVETVG